MALPHHRDRWPILWAGAALTVVTALAYRRTFSVPFVFDDLFTVVDNPTIRHWRSALTPPLESTASGRPLLNLSLAANYAFGATSVAGYHAVNLLIHLLAALTLFGIVRRTLRSVPIAFGAALLWSLHPLQTESVTYVVQRAESLMGLCYLFTLYAFIRGAAAEEVAPGRTAKLWFCLCWVACLAGMATKEVMVSAPLIVLLYDRTFVAHGLAEAWRRRWRVHAALAATWLLLLLLVFSSRARNQTAGFGTGVSWPSYALTQFPAIAHYLKLCFWPHPLLFDYATALARPSLSVLASALLVGALTAATIWALVRRPAAGFLGAVFFAILAPSSSIIPVATQTVDPPGVIVVTAPGDSVSSTVWVPVSLKKVWSNTSAETGILSSSVLKAVIELELSSP